MTSRRARLVLVLVVLGVVVLVLWAWEPLYDYVSLRRLLVDEATFEVIAVSQTSVFGGDFGTWAGHPVRGWIMEDRWTGEYGYLVGYYLETGMMALDENPTSTVWKLDGAVLCQYRFYDETGAKVKERKYSPPWWWGVTDQTVPSMPEWMKDDEKWQRALDAQD